MQEKIVILGTGFIAGYIIIAVPPTVAAQIANTILLPCQICNLSHEAYERSLHLTAH